MTLPTFYYACQVWLASTVIHAITTNLPCQAPRLHHGTQCMEGAQHSPPQGLEARGHRLYRRAVNAEPRSCSNLFAEALNLTGNHRLEEPMLVCYNAVCHTVHSALDAAATQACS